LPVFLGHDAQQQVQGLDLAEFLLKEVHPHASTVVMKLDIEGAELKVLPWLLARGALCDVDLLFAEIHGPPMISAVSTAMFYSKLLRTHDSRYEYRRTGTRSSRLSPRYPTSLGTFADKPTDCIRSHTVAGMEEGV
jgi:hypothetical protein